MNRLAVWLTTVVLATMGLMVWASPSVGAYINWTGENFIYGGTITGGGTSAASGCDTSEADEWHCYAEFADGATKAAVLRAIVPQDMPTASSLTCNIIGYTPATSGNAIFKISLDSHPSGSPVDGSLTGNFTGNITFTASATDHATIFTANATPTVIYNDAANGDCSGTTCLGAPLRVQVIRYGADGSDTLANYVRVEGVVCSY